MKKETRGIRRGRRGSALVVAIIFSTLVAIAVAALITFGMDRRRETARMIIYNAELNAAENVLDRAVSQSFFIGQKQPRQYGRDINAIGSFVNAEISSIPVPGFDTTVELMPTSVQNKVIDADDVARYGPQLQQWLGFNLNFQSFVLMAGAKANADSKLPMVGTFKRDGVYVSRAVTYYSVPLLNYAIFYDNLFELDGGQHIDVKGRVHTNDDWFLTSSSSVNYHNVCTVAGKFYGGIYHPFDWARPDGKRRWSASSNINIARTLPSTAGGTATDFKSIKQSASVIPINSQWLSSVLYGNTIAVANQVNAGTAPSPTNQWRTLNWPANPAWVDQAQTLFKGNLRDKAHGVTPIQLPIGDGQSPYLLIESPASTDGPRYDKKAINLAYQASIIIEPTSTDWVNPPTGTTTVDHLKAYRLVPTTDLATYPTGYRQEPFSLKAQDPAFPSDPTKTITFVDHKAIYNGREGKTVHLIDIDMQKLAKYLEATTPATGQANPLFKLTNDAVDDHSLPIDDGIIYVNNPPSMVLSGQPGARITNAADLSGVVTHSGITDFKGLTVGTNAPLYTKGDVNSANKIPLMLAGDSINILSNAFNDSSYASGSGNGPNQGASPTTTNAVFVSGNVPTMLNQYSGGGENFFRYLESWGSSNTHTYRGSILNLFESRIATGPWDKDAGTGTNSSYYGPPRRDWGWDPTFATGATPPGIPSAREILLDRWQILSAEEFAEAGGTLLD